MTTPHRHATHPALVARLRRANGHLRFVIEMIEMGRPCLEVAQQIQAVEKAVASAKRTLIHDHVDHCLDAGGSETDLTELKAIARYL
jgi:DNA-binding FrmR family transcriptional regulator